MIRKHRSIRLGWLVAIAAALIAACITVQCRAADFSDYLSFTDVIDGSSRQNSVLVFGGRMSTSNLGSTLIFNAYPVGITDFATPKYDNYIVGAAYQRDVYRLNGLVIAGEVGLADRFGHYAVCCDTIVYSNSIVQSGELWFGPAFRYEALVLFNQVRVVPGITAGFSATNDSIGVERGREITGDANARFLGYLGFEIAFSSVSMPALELVVEEHHRSGAGQALGHLDDAYNANAVGLRYRF